VRYSRISARTLLAALGLWLLLALSSVVGFAQNSEPSQATEGQSVSASSNGGTSDNDASKEQKQEEDQTAALQHSPSVQWVAKHTGLSVDGAYWTLIAINFLVLAGAIGFGLKSSLPKLFRARADLIRKGIEEASRSSQEANARLSDIESRLARLDSEIEQMRKHAEIAGAQEEERVRAAGEEEKRSILATADQEISAATNQARRQLKQYAAELAISIAEKNISITPTNDRELVGEFASRLGKDGQN